MRVWLCSRLVEAYFMCCCAQAAEGGRLEAAKMLLEADSQVLDIRDNCGRTPGDCVPTDSCHSLRSLLS